jgi:nucleotide-binding universal stress UspA family protein
MKILIATDGSPYNRLAVEQFLSGPIVAGTEVRIVSAYKRSSPMMTTEPMGILRQSYAEADNEAFKAAGKAADFAADIVRGKNTGFAVMTAVIDGSPKTVILKEAENFGANLIVVGASGHGFAERFMLGSVSQAVAMHAKCSVEIVRMQK